MVQRKIAKRNRVYSLESNKKRPVVGMALFARKYVNYLEPALKKINENTTLSSFSSSSSIKPINGDDDDNVNCIEKLVRFEVDMAMAVSAKDHQFAWSRSLEAQLQLRNVHNNVGGFQQHLATNSSPNHQPFTAIVDDQEKVGESLLGTSFSSPNDASNITMVPLMHISKKYKHSSISKTSSSRRSKVQVQEAKNWKEEEEEEVIKNRLRQLRMVLPGGKEMGDEDDVELLTEIASYITCLQLQVNILQCLVGN